MTKGNQVKQILYGLITEEENKWTAKKRELFTVSELLKLEWLNNGEDFKSDKKFITQLKECYFNYQHDEITSSNMLHDYYIIHEAFGSQSSPDYLFITPNGIFGIEDKSSDNGMISWNTGTPGDNKIITYFDKKHKKVYLVSSYDYEWGPELGIEYKEFTQEIIEYARIKFKERFGEKLNGKRYSFYARAMLNHGTKIKDIYDDTEENVDYILNTYLGED